MSLRFARVHATCLKLGPAGKAFRAPQKAGVLILGPSGAGKSDLALRLMAAGASLVADDQTELFLKRGRLHGRAPRRLKGLMEIRGLGIVDMPYTEDVPIALVVTLSGKPARLPMPVRYAPPAALDVRTHNYPPLIVIDARDASAAAKLVAAVAAHTRGAFRDHVKKE